MGGEGWGRVGKGRVFEPSWDFLFKYATVGHLWMVKRSIKNYWKFTRKSTKMAKSPHHGHMIYCCQSHCLCTFSSSLAWNWKNLIVPIQIKTIHYSVPTQMTYPGSTDDLSKVYIHPIVTAHKMSIVSFSILQFHQLKGKSSRLLQELIKMPTYRSYFWKQLTKNWFRLPVHKFHGSIIRLYKCNSLYVL